MAAWLALANSSMSSTVSPSIYGTAATRTLSRRMYCIVIDFIRYQAYILVAVYKLLEEVDIHRLERGKVDLAIAEQEVVELLLRLHLGAEFVHVDLGVRHVLYRIRHL